MRADEFRCELAEIAARTPAPDADAAATIAHGRRRLFRRRASIVGVLAIVGLFVGVVANHHDSQRGLVVSPTPSTLAPAPPPKPITGATSVLFTSANEGWVCANPILHTANGGETWQAQASSALAAGTRTCAAVPTDAWIFVQAPGGGVTLLPAQGGANIAVSIGLPKLPTGAVVRQATFVDKNTGWMLAVADNGETNQGLLYRTTSGLGRQDFTLVSSAAPVGGVQFANANEGWGIDGSQLQQTTDGGATWRAVSVPTPPPVARELGVFLDRVIVHGSTIVVAGNDPSGSTSRAFFLLSTDAGNTWAERNGPPATFGTTQTRLFDAVDADHWRFAFGNTTWNTDDGGSTWSPRVFPAGTVSIAFPTPDIGWATDDNSRVLQTTDGARSWHVVDTTAQQPWYRGLAAIPDECPSASITAPPAGTDALAAATQAAKDFVLRTRGWTGENVLGAYPVMQPGGEWGVVFSTSVPKYCGRPVADASYGVELGNPSVTEDSSRATALVVAHFADGWKVWGFYR